MVCPAASPAEINIESIKIDKGGVKYEYPNINIPTLTSRFRIPLEAGKSYTLTVDLRTTRWAGSNIYWDGSQLTFKPAGYPGVEKYYQGLFFKWGSLIGISPVSQFSASTTPIYFPDSPTPTTGSAKGWSLFGGISYLNMLTGGSRGALDVYNNGNFANYTGDICKYLSENGDVPAGNWRMPTSNEFGDVGGASDKLFYWEGNTPLASTIDWYKGTNDAGSNYAQFNAFSGNEYGTGIFNYASGAGYAFYQGATFPASGYMDGNVWTPGTFGYYHSNSGSSMNGFVYFMRFYATVVQPAYVNSGNAGTPIRCIKNE
jgi:hypothetical protein